MRRLAVWGFAMLVGGCSVFGPKASEGEGVGSNTNWFRACDVDSECGADLGCICGTCTRACNADDDCTEPKGVCPVDRGAFRSMCSSQEGQQLLSTGFCAPSCELDEDCGDGELCVGGSCSHVPVAPCVGAVRLDLEVNGQSRARTGALFGDAYYEPVYFSGVPAGWQEPYEPNTYTARVTDDAGEPIEGCEVHFVSDEASGTVFSAAGLTDASGEQTALWVAGAAPSQELSAVVVQEGGNLLKVSFSGEARRHDEAPMSSLDEAVSYTAPTAIVAWPDVVTEIEGVQIDVTPHTFPAWVSYVPLDTEGLSLRLRNRGTTSASQGDVAAEDRALFIEAASTGGVAAEVLAWHTDAVCSTEPSGASCVVSDAWEVRQQQSLRVMPHHVEYGVIPSYPSAAHGECVCLGVDGCTDYEVFSTREGQDEELVAIVRYPGVDTLSHRALSVSGTYRSDVRVQGSCLELEKAHMTARPRLLVDGEWVLDEGASGWAYHQTWQNQTCANYFMSLLNGEYEMSTGGSGLFSTPVLPGDFLSL